MLESITLKQMADLTGFSVSTVSKAWNDKPDISTSTKKIIREIAKNYNYTPNHLAVSLRKQKTETIAIIVPDISITKYACIVSEMQKLAFKKGLKLLVFQHFEDKKMGDKCLKILNNSILDGAIIITSKLDKDICSRSILMPNIVFEFEQYHESNLNYEKLVDRYLVLLFEKIE